MSNLIKIPNIGSVGISDQTSLGPYFAIAGSLHEFCCFFGIYAHSGVGPGSPGCIRVFTCPATGYNSVFGATELQNGSEPVYRPTHTRTHPATQSMRCNTISRQTISHSARFLRNAFKSCVVYDYDVNANLVALF